MILETRVPSVPLRAEPASWPLHPVLPSPLAAVVFDMDGLLLDTETMFREVAFSVCRDLGFELLDDVHLSMIGLPADRGEALLRGHFGETFPYPDYHANCRTLFRTRCNEGVPVKTGAHDILVRLSELGIPAAVATSTNRPAALDHLEQAGLLPRFQAVVARDDVQHGKPHPEPFLTAAERLGVDPQSCLALEDSHNGIRAAHAAGMRVVMVPDLLAPTDEIERLCAAVVPDLDAVRRLIEDAVKPARSPAPAAGR